MEVSRLITCKNDRMLELLWFIGYCGELPSQLALRVGGHPEWNRHVKYRAIQEGYVTVFRGKNRQRVIRSLRLTEKGIDYISERDPEALAYILSKNHGGIITRNNMEKTMRRHSLAIGLLMSANAEAEILPGKKPSLMPDAPKVTPRDWGPIYYSTEEIRAGIQAYEPDTVAKTSRIIGIIVSGNQCFCLYHTGHSRMYWMRTQEENTVAAIDALLITRGFSCTVFNQVLIGSNLNLAVKISRYKLNSRSRYFTLSEEYNHCYYLENSFYGDELLRILIHPELSWKTDRAALKGYEPPPAWARTCDATENSGRRPVILGYQFDLLKLHELDGVHLGFPQSPILLCFDYQRDALQAIAGPLIEVRSFSGGLAHERKNE